ncbi:hypothetical protein ESCNG_20005 [Neisseria gonorrhoeae]|nr:hypothetical protein ESCNG_20005 [Neisseria gonorrhoeae]
MNLFFYKSCFIWITMRHGYLYPEKY